jgi:hypothetical protein
MMRFARQIIVGALLAFFLLAASISEHFEQVWKVLPAFLLMILIPICRRVFGAYVRKPLLATSATIMALIVMSGLFQGRVPISKTQAIGFEDYYFYWLKDFGPISPKNLPAWPYEIRAALEFHWGGVAI